MSSRRIVPLSETGEILDKQRLTEQPDSHGITYVKFKNEIKAYTEEEEEILSELTNSVRVNRAQEVFNQLVLNFKGKDSLIRKYMVEVDKQMRELRGEILKDAQSPAKSYTTELKKLEVSKLEMFKWLLQKELKNENFRKQEALKKFMAVCVNNELAPETPDS
ncbi:unnamed protein product [Candidula unifasciata]|uniref:Uncharacterized protein n=1 Tax=Candidula unifasciata TaxID=100452 RepID=A0A8S3ZHI0_9EUPU|nr:unnamed protein product [Candidula unifasciata]